MDAYAANGGMGRDEYLDQFGPTLMPEEVANCVRDLAAGGDDLGPAYALTAEGLTALA